MTNFLRPIEVAPGITVAAKDLTKVEIEFIATHHLAGHAVIRRCTYSGPGLHTEYWTIEPAFHGEDPVEPVRGQDLDWTEHNDFTTMDQALIGLSILAAQWVVEHPLLAHQRGMRDLG